MLQCYTLCLVHLKILMISPAVEVTKMRHDNHILIIYSAQIWIWIVWILLNCKNVWFHQCAFNLSTTDLTKFLWLAYKLIWEFNSIQQIAAASSPAFSGNRPTYKAILLIWLQSVGLASSKSCFIMHLLILPYLQTHRENEVLLSPSRHYLYFLDHLRSHDKSKYQYWIFSYI